MLRRILLRVYKLHDEDHCLPRCDDVLLVLKLPVPDVSLFTVRLRTDRNEY
jgi:hypothetical protein